MSVRSRRQQVLLSARSLPGLGMRCHEGLSESGRGLLVAALVDPRRSAEDTARAPGLRKCQPTRRTPLSLQLELFARTVGRVR